MNNTKLLAIAAISVFGAIPGISDAAAATPQQTSANCAINTAIKNDAAKNYDRTTGAIINNSFNSPANVASASCISSLLNIGSSIGIPSGSISELINSLENRACGAARSAESNSLNKLNNALPVGGGWFNITNYGGGNQTYSRDQTQKAVNSIWGALN